MFIGADTHALSGPATATALEVFAANGVTVMLDSADGYTPTPAVSHAILKANRKRTSKLADGIVRHAQPQPAAGRRLQVQPAERRPGRQRRHLGDRRPGERHPGRRAGRREADELRVREERRHHRLLRLHLRLRRRPGERAGHRRHPGRRRAHRRRPARRRVGGLLGGDRRAAAPRSDGAEQGRRPDLVVHDAGLGRQDPDGLLVAERDGVGGGQGRPTTTSPPATTPTPTGTASSRPTPA